MRQEVKKSENAVEAYRQRAGLITSKGKSVASQQVADLSTQVILAKTARAEASARLRQAENLLKSPGGASSSAEVLGSQLIQRLREKESEIERHAAELAEEYGDRHPKILNIKAELRDLESKIRSEVAKIVKGLKNEVEIARTREVALVNNLRRLESRVSKANNSEVKLRALEREAKANRDLLETFLARFGETRAQEDMDAQEPDARVISRAAVPAEPSFPRRGIIFILAFAGSSIIGISLALVIDLIGRGFQTSEQLEQATGLPVYTLIPILDRKWMGDIVSSPEDFIVESPGSAFGESIRSLHTSILLSRLDEPPKTALVTSAFPEEGKTTIVICLARLLATTGRSVLILDCDLRKPLVADTVGLPRTLPGLVELLTGNASYEDVIVKDPSSNAFILPAGSGGGSPAEILSSEAFHECLSTLGEMFDLVIIDSPPMMAVSDARVLSTMVDTTIFAVRWSKTPRDVVIKCLRMFPPAQLNRLGLALSLVNIKKHDKYYYTGSRYYNKRLTSYYHE